MKIAVAGDIHGKEEQAKQFINRAKEDGVEKIILLGDLYRGETAVIDEILNSTFIPVIRVEGNCDKHYNERSSIVNSGAYHLEVCKNRKLFFTHGHLYNLFNMPTFLDKGDVFIYGHSHKNTLAMHNGILFANPGSVGEPRDTCENSYMLIEDDKFYIKTLDGRIIDYKVLI